MSWIKTINYEEAAGQLKKLYDRVKSRDHHIDNILKVHSLRPHTLLGHMTLYKNVLHHQNNTLPARFLEIIGIYVSILNDCTYCIEHHSAGLRKLLGDKERAGKIISALKEGSFHSAVDEKKAGALAYVRKLNDEPGSINESDIQQLRDLGFTDGEILEINQVAAYFSYANRTVSGLGVTIKGDILGLSPRDSKNPENWHHE